MKTFLFILTMLAAGTLAAQPGTNTDKSAKTETVPPPAQNPIVVKTQPANEIKSGKVTYSGVIVQAIKSRHPAQLLNPLAPAEYGAGDCNLHRDIITQKADGFSFFSIKF